MSVSTKTWMMVGFVFLLLVLFIFLSPGGRKGEIPTAKQAVGYVGFCLFDGNLSISTPMPDYEIIVNDSFYFDINITNPSNQTITFRDDTPLFDIGNSTGIINFTPNDTQIGVYYVNITLFDACGNFRDFEFSTLTVKYEDNLPPVLDFIPDQYILQNDHFIYDVNATDPNFDTLTFGDNATFFVINPSTGRIDFIPVQDDVGNHSVIIYVIDPYDALDFQTVLFSIIDVNDPPVLSPIGSRTALINTTYYLDINATDVDPVLPHNITFYDNATFFDIDNQTGVISFWVNDSLTGTYTINISVTDGEAWDWEVISFTITDVNHPPNITSWDPLEYELEMSEGESQEFHITKEDPDGGIPSTQWYVDGNPVSGETSDDYVYYASYVSAGIHNITVIVSDGFLTDMHNWTLSVLDAPEPPPASSGGASTGTGGGAVVVCTENWRCSAWSICPVYGVQVRECIDLNSCGTTFSKPETSRSCTYVSEPSCNDGVRNCHDGDCEILTDCGGPCQPCLTCSDGIQNQNETGIDCGGPCPPCLILPRQAVCGDGICDPEESLTCISDCGISMLFLLLQYVLLIVVLAAILIYSYRGYNSLLLLYKKRKTPLFTETQLLGIKYLKPIISLEISIGKESSRKIATELAKNVKMFFSDRFKIKSTATYEEIIKTLRKGKIKESIIDSISSTSGILSSIEYGKGKITEEELITAAISSLSFIGKLSEIPVHKAMDRGMEEAYVGRIKELISLAEQELGKGETEKALVTYKLIKGMYDELSESEKRELYGETQKIVSLYNAIIGKLK